MRRIVCIVAVSSGGYEKACVLFNIAALQSQVADNHNHKTDDGLKQSAKLFQVSRRTFVLLFVGLFIFESRKKKSFRSAA